MHRKKQGPFRATLRPSRLFFNGIGYSYFPQVIMVELQYNEPRYNKVRAITNDINQPGQSHSKMYSTEPR